MTVVEINYSEWFGVAVQRVQHVLLKQQQQLRFCDVFLLTKLSSFILITNIQGFHYTLAKCAETNWCSILKIINLILYLYVFITYDL